MCDHEKRIADLEALLSEAGDLLFLLAMKSVPANQNVMGWVEVMEKTAQFLEKIDHKG